MDSYRPGEDRRDRDGDDRTHDNPPKYPDRDRDRDDHYSRAPRYDYRDSRGDRYHGKFLR